MNTLVIALVLLTVYVSSSQAQILRFGPRFEIGRYDVTEGQNLSVRLSASILTHSLLTTGPFSSADGEIEVDICIENGTELPLATPGSDYVLCDTVPGGNWTDRFTVQFVLRQANSSTVDICIGDDSIFEDTEHFQLRICAVRFSESISGILGTATGFDSVTAPVEIDDNDVVCIHWERNSVTVTEGEDRQVGLRAVADGVYARPISIGVQCSPVDSTNGRPASRNTDWIVTQTQLTFSSVDTLTSVSDLPLRALIVNDSFAEPQESFLCNLQSGNADPVKAVPPTQITVTIVDNDELIISWERDFYEFRESETATVTLVTDSNFESDVVVNGFPSRISENRITCSLPGPTFEGFGQFPATINKVEFRGVRYGVARVAGIRQEPDVASTFDDFLFTSTVKRSCENFDIKNDSILECDELLRAEFSISNLLEDGWLARKGQFPIAYIAIEDDDFVTVNFNQSEYVVNESAGQVTISLEITGQFFKNVSATFECINGSATDPLDWCNATTYTVNFNQTVTSDESPPAFTALSDPVYLTIKDDSLVEGDEVFLCRIVSTSDSIRVQIGPRNEVPVIIEDDDFAVCRYEEELYRVAEEAGYLEVALVLDQAALIPLSVNASTLFLLDDSVGDAASVVDFLSINELIITFPPEVTRVPFNITIIDDILPENSEFFNLDLNLVGGGGDSRFLQIGSPKQPLVEIFDSDAVVSISLDSTTYSIFENETRVIVTLQLSAPYTQNISVEVSLSENADLAELVRAVAGVDFESSDFPRSVTIPAGQTSVSLPVLVIDEGIVEKDEGFIVSFSYTAGQPGVSVTPGFDQANITIKNDDELRVRFEQELYTVIEDNVTVSVKIIASSTASFDYEVDIAISDISAVFPEDYSERQFNLSFPAGATNFIFEIPIVDDEVFEGTENFSLSIIIHQASADSGVKPGVPIKAFVNILDDEVVNVFFDPTSDIVTEGEDAELTVRADRDFTIPFSVIVTLSDDSAVAPGDYNSSQSPYVLTFQPGQSTQTILVPTNDDTTVEMTEMFTAALSLPAVNPTPGVVVIQPDEATVAILDNEEPLVVVLRRNETVPEGQDASVLVEVSSTDYEFDFTVTLSTTDIPDSAEAPADYQPGPYTTSFTAGQASAVVPVGTEDDDISELTEHFKVTIDSTSQKDRVEIGVDNTSFVTILDDDDVTCSFFDDSISVTEGESARVTIDISSSDFSFPFTVTLSYMDGSAVEGEDYTRGNITVEFAPGQSSVSFDVPTIDDDRVEKLENFKIMKVNSSQPDKVSPASPDMVTIEIIDNDERTLSIIPQNYTVVEGQKVNITLELDSDEFDCEFNVTLVNTDMSATAPEDYTSGPYTVTFQPNQTTAVLMIPTEDDSIAELTEVFKVEISSTSIPDQILIGEPDDSYVTILDNDVIECSKAPENATVTEGEVAFLIIVCSGEYEFDFTLNLNSMDDSAVAPGDYIGGPYSTVFTAGQQSDILPVVTNDDSIAEMDQVFKVMITGSDRPDKVIIVQPDTCYVTIEDDDDVVTCQKAAENITVTEGQLVNVTIECSGEYEFDFTLDVATMDGSAFAPGDYEAGVMNVPFSAGEASRSVSGVTIDDSVIELEEFFKLTISGSDQGDKVVIAEPRMCFVIVRDNDGLSCFFSDDSISVTEGESARVTIETSSADFSFPFTVTLSYMDGSAVEGEDYTRGNITVEFAPGQSSASFDVPTIDDDRVEKLENFKIMKVGTSESDKVSQGTPSMITVEIQDNDVLVVMFQPDDYQVAEGETATVSLITNLAYSFNFTVNVVCENGTAFSPDDFTDGMFTAEFLASPNEAGRASIQVQTIPDNVFEALEFFKCSLIVPDMDMDNVVSGQPDMARVNITDNTGADCFFNPDVYLINEGSNATIIVETSVTVAKRFSCIVTTEDDSANSPSDYISGTKVAIFEIGSTSAEVVYRTVFDEIREGLESFRARLSVSEPMMAMGVRAVDPELALVDIIDDDELFVMFERNMYMVTEGNPPPEDGLLNVTIIATRQCEDPYTLNIVASDGSATEGEDYRGQSFTVTIPALTTAATFSVPIINDLVFESDETFFLQIEAPQNRDGECRDVKLGSPDRATVLIKNDEPVVTIEIEESDLDVVENENMVEVCLVKSGPSTEPIMAMLIVEEIVSGSGDSNVSAASENDDFSPVPVPDTLTIPPNVTRMCFDVLINDDPMVERTEPFKITVVFPPDQPALQNGELSIASGDNGTITGTINIQDDDNITIEFEFDMYMRNESDALFEVSILASGSASFPYSFEVSFMNIEAVEPFDYVFIPLTRIFEPGQTSTTFSVPIVDDNFDEIDESFKLIITIPESSRQAGVSVGVKSVTTLIIKDNDVPEAVFNPQNYSVPEGSNASITVVLDKIPVKQCTVTVTTVDLSAEGSVDYTPVVRDLIFMPNQSSVTFAVPTILDGEKEQQEFFRVDLTTTDDECVVGTPAQAFVRILDDSVLSVQFEREMYMTFEVDGMVEVRIIASSPSDFAYDIVVSSMDIEAIDPDDYTFPDMTLTFAPGEVDKLLSIPVFPDMLDERNETFKLTITIPEASGSQGVQEGDPITAVVLIKDSDVPEAVFNPQNYSVPEGSAANITVVLDKIPVEQCTVTVTTVDLSAEDTLDYSGVVAEVVFPAGQTSATFSVNTLGDVLLEGDEHFKVVLSAGDGGCSVGSPDEAFVTVQDQQVDVIVRFNPDTYVVTEGQDGNAVISLEADGEHGFDFVVMVRAMDGSAIIDEDYEGDLFSVLFPANVNTASFNLSILDDQFAESPENLTLKLEVPADEAAKGVQLGSPDVALVTILDDDDLVISFVVPSYTVKENVGTVTVEVTASRPANFDYSVTVRTAEDTAMTPEDFEDNTFTVNFPAGSTQQSFDVVITDDNILEEMESLDLQLSISDDLIDMGVQVGSNGRAVINIMDNDLVVRFRRPEVSVPEENERAPVEVLALGDLSMDFSIIVMAINGSAIENLDFIGNMWMVDFPSAVSSQSFFIPIVQDAVVEDTELFTLKIVVSDELSRRLTVASPEIMTVIITDLVNDTVIGDPLFTVPLPSLHIDDDKLKGSALCFEYHGHSGEHYNLISDSCVSVNTLYSAGVNKSKLNVMSEIGIRAEDSAGGCHTISVLREGCSASLNGAPVTGTVSRGGVVITARRSRVRVSLPNCESQKRLTLWVLCNRRNDEDMLEIVVSRGDGLRPTAHGLIGQFWNVPIGIEPYTGVFDGKQLNKDDGVYLVNVAYPGSQNRTFVAEFRPRAWDSKVPCLYAGNSMAGPMAEAPQYRDNVIDGAVNSYNVDNLFTTDYQHSKYKSRDCN